MSITKEYFPLIIAYCSIERNNSRFFLPGRIVTLRNVNSSLLKETLNTCAGYLPYHKVLKKIINHGYSTKEVEHLISILMKNNIVVNSLKYYEIFHSVSENPLIYWAENDAEKVGKMLKSESFLFPDFSRQKTYLEKLLENRRSTRHFSKQKLSDKNILRLIWATYGRIKRSDNLKKSTIGVGTIPSAGGLYPLRLQVIIIHKSRSLIPKLYAVSKHGLKYKKEVSSSLLKKIFIGFIEEIENASLILILSGKFDQSSQKYFNRGYRYTILEAGHAAQNAYLWCTEQKVGITEVGSFNDILLSNLLEMNYPSEAVITSLVIGKYA